MAGTIHVRGEGGAIFAMDPPLSEQHEQALRTGRLVRVNPDGSPAADEPAVPVAAPPAEMPARSASKAAWVAWAVVQGTLADDAEAMTKSDLIESFGHGQ